MKSFLILVLFAMVSSGYGLKCYKCNGKEADCTKDKLTGDKSQYLQNCTGFPAGEELQCQRNWWKKDGEAQVLNQCSIKKNCEESKKTCDDGTGGAAEFDACAVACCDTDECNASSAVSFSVIFMTACSVFGLALMK